PEIETLSPRFLRQFRCLPVSIQGNTLTLALADPLDLETRNTVRACTGLEVTPVLAAEAEILEAIDRYYGQSEKREADADYNAAEANEDLEHLRDMASEAPVIRMVNGMIAQAVESRASDIHIEPFEKEFRIRYRIDGVLVPQEAPPRDVKAAIISRVKLMAKLNIAERRLPQDGRIKVKTLGREVDLRVSTLPTLYGESVVMRLLDRSAGDFYDLRRLGFDDFMLSRMEYYTSLPHGIFLVTGPTGSGKSTTLYSALKRINQTDKKIITIEDPVEYQMDGINQIHVNPQIGLTFASGLRHIVRQDPDVIMVGEIRDRETADVAIRAALTGHFVYSTLHTNDAPSAITRLTDMGVENYLITSSLVAVLAQRLVRVICRNCRVPDQEVLTPSGDKVLAYKGAGCDKCFGLGMRGRMGIFEMMELNDEIRQRIMNNEDASILTQAARRNGMRTLREDGWLKVSQGVTTPYEVTRVTQEF
ncbi:MAG: ATPase, T2SS/T4P/T4SS family, partial [Bryobacteraceae bacterium]|nr:ATPase, T2SS/T4P/T4SS family [Bryobacteraceae bacterium]